MKTNGSAGTGPFNYVACFYGTLKKPGPQARIDGQRLAQQCIRKLGKVKNREQFPPKLLILLTTPAYLHKGQLNQLLTGIHEEFDKTGCGNVSLIGSTVAGVIFGGGVHQSGALLICVASRVFNAKVVVAQNAREDPEGAIRELAQAFDIGNGERGNKDPNPLGDRWIIAFFPGFGSLQDKNRYPAPELHAMLRDLVRSRIAIAGGVTSVGDADSDHRGFQFAGGHVFSDAVVCAMIETGAPFAISSAHGFVPGEQSPQIGELSDDGYKIVRFAGDENPKAVVERLQDNKGLFLFQETPPDRDPVIVMPEINEDGSVTVQRRLTKDAVLRVLRPHRESITNAATQSVCSSLQRICLDRPVISILFACSCRHRHRKKIGLHLCDALRKLSELTKGILCVGGLFDGEAGLDSQGRSYLTNWAIVSVVLGDEVRERCVVDRGFAAMARHAPDLLKSPSIDGVIKHSLDLVYEMGWPGAMLSFVFSDERHRWIVGHMAIGTRFERIVNSTRRPFPGEDILAGLANERKSEFIPDSRKDPRCNKKAIKSSGLVSQYIIPLPGLDGETFATLQIDLGDLSHYQSPPKHVKRALDSVGEEIAAALVRCLGREQLAIARQLDKVLSQCMADDTLAAGVQRYVEAAVESLGAQMGHVRIADGGKLKLLAGVGPYFGAALKDRKTIDHDDVSPTGEALRVGRTIVTNAVATDPSHRCMLGRFSAGTRLGDAIRKQGSFANVPLRDEKGDVVGNINIASEEEWFFNASRARSLEDLGNRLSFLVSHLRRKIRDRENSRRIAFLLEFGGQPTVDYSGADKSLQAVMDRCQKATNAVTASLFLWDEEVDAYVLRAESGWADPRWIGAARYKKSQGWTGRIAELNEPSYIPDLGKYKKDNWNESIGSYANEMFGGIPGKDFTVEAIALPLRIGPRNIGVLTMHRRTLRSSLSVGSDFTTTDIQLLREAAEHMAISVDGIVSHQKDAWENQERDRREDVLHAAISHYPRSGLESEICGHLIDSYRAREADFFSLRDIGSEPRLQWVTGLTRAEEQSSPPVVRDAPVRVDNVVRRCLASGKVEVERHSIGSRRKSDPSHFAGLDRVTRACIPITAERNTIGILDLRWNLPPIRTESLVVLHNEKHLLMLGARLGAIIYGKQLVQQAEAARREAECIQRAMNAMNAMIFQSGHRFGNLIQRLGALVDRLAEADDEDQRREYLKTLSHYISEGKSMIRRPLDVVESMRTATRTNVSLAELVQLVLPHRLPDPLARHLEAIVEIPLEATAYVNKEQIQEAFTNIIDNSIKAMPTGGVLRIRCQLNEARGLFLVTFEDSGKGMTDGEIKAALTGFFTTRSSLGVGVLIARLLIESNGGSLNIESTKNVGTRVLIHLPTHMAEESI